MLIHQQVVVENDTPDEWRRVEDLARERRKALLMSSSAATVSPAQEVWNRVTKGLRSQELLKVLNADHSSAETPAELSARLRPTGDGSALEKKSVRAIIRNIRRAEKRLMDEGRISRRVVQADWSNADGCNRYYVLPEDGKVLGRL